MPLTVLNTTVLTVCCQPAMMIHTLNIFYSNGTLTAAWYQAHTPQTTSCCLLHSPGIADVVEFSHTTMVAPAPALRHGSGDAASNVSQAVQLRCNSNPSIITTPPTQQLHYQPSPTVAACEPNMHHRNTEAQPSAALSTPQAAACFFLGNKHAPGA
jgi:hypothetical protein